MTLSIIAKFLPPLQSSGTGPRQLPACLGQALQISHVCAVTPSERLAWKHTASVPKSAVGEEALASLVYVPLMVVSSISASSR